jgi:hypothetical protein
LNPYKSVPRPSIGRSVFDLSYEKKFTCDMGELIPIMVDEMVPGDVFDVAHNIVIRFQPLVAPVMHEVNCYIETFFVPYRIIWDDWEDFITGGEDGTSAPTLPTWAFNLTAGSLGDYLGMPTGVAVGTGAQPVDFPLRAYNSVYNEYYRDQTQEAEILLTSNTLQIRNWEKDYFTSALPWEQRGTAPALPISGVFNVDSQDNDINVKNTTDATARALQTVVTTGNIAMASAPSGTANMRWVDPRLEVDMSNATTFDVNDLRLAFQTQKLLERAATGGSRYEEFLQSMYATSPGDARIQRPEWIGGMKVPVIFSEVLQTSEDGTTPQGNMAGHGITVGTKRVGHYRAKEFGVIISIMSVMPKSAYSQGVQRQWLKSTRYDYFNPLFANLGEQPITHAEIYASATPADNTSVFGYQGRYNEMRKKENMIAGDMRATYDYWHLGRQFSGKPSLNAGFLEYDGRKDIFAAPSVDGLIVNAGNIIKAVRPLPIMPSPGYIDH